MGRTRNEEIVAPGGFTVWQGEGSTMLFQTGNSSIAPQFNDANGNEILKGPTAATASAVNEVTITNAATTVAPTIAASGGDTNVGLRLSGKGTGVVGAEAPITEKITITTISATGATTITAAQLLNKFIIYSGNGAATHTLPTAALLVAALPGCKVNDSFMVTFRNTGNNTLTVASGSGGTDFAGGTMTVATVHTRSFLIVINNVTASSEAYTTYSMQDSAH